MSHAVEQRRLYRLIRPDPLGIPRNPLAVYLLCLCLASGLSTLLGYSTARSIEQQLPPFVGSTWGGMLAFGSTATLLGMFWPASITTGLLLKRTGTFALSVASFIYAAVILLAFGHGGVFTAGIIFGFGVASAVQCGIINRRINEIIRATNE